MENLCVFPVQCSYLYIFVCANHTRFIIIIIIIVISRRCRCLCDRVNVCVRRSCAISHNLRYLFGIFFCRRRRRRRRSR